MWHSSKALITGNSDPDIDAALDKEQLETDPVERGRILQQEALPAIARSMPSLSLFTSVLIHGINDGLKDAYFYPNGPIDLTKATIS